MGCELSKPVTTSPNSNCDDLQLQGVSVDYLNTTFIKDIKNAGHDINKVTVYDLEPDLESEIYGFIRRKGAKVICPRDGKVGASYVDSIKEKAAVGKAIKDFNEGKTSKTAEKLDDKKQKAKK